MTSEPAAGTPARYLESAMTKLRDLGLVPDKTHEAPIIDLLNRITDLDEERVVSIARTLNQASLFNEVVREQLTSMSVGERYEDIADSFDSIRKDAKGMVEQLDDGKIDTWERLGNVWMKVSRGDISDRFQDIKSTYLEVAEGLEGSDRARAHHHGCLPRFPRCAQAGGGAGTRGSRYC